MKLYGFEMHDPNYESAFVWEELYDNLEMLRERLKKEGYTKMIPYNGDYRIIDETWVHGEPKDMSGRIMLRDLRHVKHGFVREFIYDASWRIAEH